MGSWGLKFPAIRQSERPTVDVYYKSDRKKINDFGHFERWQILQQWPLAAVRGFYEVARQSEILTRN